MKTFSMTDKGWTRFMNQDYLFSAEKPLGNLPNFFLVADGMGGHQAGDYASRYAVETIVEEIAKSKETEPVAIFLHAIEKANRELMRKASQEEELAGMGTTVVMATLVGTHMFVANVGDSRLYVVGEEICQITRDHSLVEEMVRRGELQREAARVHPDKNIITRAVGAFENVAPDIFEVDVKETDRILLCSDGLTNMVEDCEIQSILQGQGDIVEKVKRLVECANANGGKDNITVVAIEPF